MSYGEQKYPGSIRPAGQAEPRCISRKSQMEFRPELISAVVGIRHMIKKACVATRRTVLGVRMAWVCGALALMKRRVRRASRGLRTRALHWVGSVNPPAHYRGKYAECTQMRAPPPHPAAAALCTHPPPTPLKTPNWLRKFSRNNCLFMVLMM